MSAALSFPNGGFSIDPRTGTHIHTGYAVAIHPEHARILDADITAAELHEFVRDARHVLAAPGHILGAWRKPATGQIHLDISIVTPDLCCALTIARWTRQLAIFDLSCSLTIHLSDAIAAGR